MLSNQLFHPRRSLRARALLPIVILLTALLGLCGPAGAQVTAIYSFTAGNDGDGPSFPPIQASDGNLYGTAGGGANGYGTLYRCTLGGSLTPLYEFQGSGSSSGSSGPLTQASNGYLYGTNGAAGADGVIFKSSLSGSVSTVYTFTGSNDGLASGPALIQLPNGYLYGTSIYGGTLSTGSWGIVFKIDLNGNFSIVHSFNGATEGAAPGAYLTYASDGNLYGTTATDGSGNYGTVFRMNPTTGTVKVLHSFTDGTDGGEPDGGLIQASDGNLYGTTTLGGSSGAGVLYRITLSNGVFTRLYSFTGGSDGSQPSHLLQASDGMLYGTCRYGGNVSGLGTVFKSDLKGNVQSVWEFTGGSDGDAPSGGLTRASDGNLYGVCLGGGAETVGTIFRVAIGSVPGDFNGDGKSDLLLMNPSTGQLAVWFMNGVQASGGAFVSKSQVAGWLCVGVGDFNKDGHPDILFQNSSSGQLALWTMNGTSVTGGTLISPTPPAGWKVVSVADFNGDGSPGLLLQNQSSGQLAVWFMQGTSVIGGNFVNSTPPAGWVAVGTGDFNGDGKPDVLFQNSSSGQLAVWFMNGTTTTGGAYITPGQSAVWKCVAVPDLYGDGHLELIFQNKSTGQLAYWILNGTTATNGNYLPNQPPAGWLVVAPH